MLLHLSYKPFYFKKNMNYSFTVLLFVLNFSSSFFNIRLETVGLYDIAYLFLKNNYNSFE